MGKLKLYGTTYVANIEIVEISTFRQEEERYAKEENPHDVIKKATIASIDIGSGTLENLKEKIGKHVELIDGSTTTIG